MYDGRLSIEFLARLAGAVSVNAEMTTFAATPDISEASPGDTSNGFVVTVMRHGGKTS